MSTYKSFCQRYLEKTLAARSFKFQRQNLIKQDFLGPWFVRTSPELSESIFEKIISKNIEIRT